MVGECVCGGWPTGWFTNGKSPFPVLVAFTVMRNSGYGTFGDAYEPTFTTDATYVLWHAFVNAAGWGPVKRMFTLFRTLRVDLSNIPEALKSAYLIAGLILSGGPNFSSNLQAATGIDVSGSLAAAELALGGAGGALSVTVHVQDAGSQAVSGATVTLN